MLQNISPRVVWRECEPAYITEAIGSVTARDCNSRFFSVSPEVQEDHERLDLPRFMPNMKGMLRRAHNATHRRQFLYLDGRNHQNFLVFGERSMTPTSGRATGFVVGCSITIRTVWPRVAERPRRCDTRLDPTRPRPPVRRVPP